MGGVSEGAAEVDWDGLRAAARGMIAYAYVPYSRYPVGAAALVDDGRVVTGCNVENASYGVTLCAECGLVSSLAASGGGRLVAFACVDGHGAALMPCGRCRQLLWEHGGPELLVDTPEGILPMTAVLPARKTCGDPDGRVTASPTVASATSTLATVPLVSSTL